MGLLNPLGLAWLALAVPILLLYLLRLRRREQVVASVLFWEHAIDDLQANAPFQRLRRNLLLYLQLLVLLCAVLAAARPFRRTHQLGGGTVIAVLDVSASMAAPLAGSSRFEVARQRVGALIDGLARGEELMLVTASDRPLVVHGLSADRRSLQRALAAVRLTDRPTDLRDALALASSVARSRGEAARVYLLSDAAGPPQEAVAADLAKVELVPCGAAVDNVGITALQMRRTFDDRPRPQVLLALEASGPSRAPREVEVELRADNRLFDIRRYTLTPGQPRSLILEDLPSDRGRLEVRLTGQDALPGDDRAYVSLGAARRTEVGLVGQPDRFLEQALRLEPGLDLVKYDSATFTAALAQDRVAAGTLLVFCGNAPSADPQRPAIYLNCGGEGAPVELLGEVSQPTVVDWATQHPVTSFVDFNEVAIAKARRARARPWARVLLDSTATPLLVVGERDGRRVAWLGFDLLDSDLPLRAGFPILIGNLVRWLTAGTAQGEALAVQAGETVTLELPNGPAVVTTPDQRQEHLTVTGGRLAYGDTDRVGVYTVRAGDQEREFAVSLLAAAESNATPQQELRFGRAKVLPPSEQTLRVRELWRWLVAAALAFLLLEWWWYHRRG
ncbi:MAG: VWA domain-containing protein [Fimbriimonadaceae bacterium]|nr:VWA domain-containing protein [Fimbriimonadaceae bacterium]